jgi:hypothetical protein
VLSDFSASSFSKARRRFPFEFFVDLCQWIYKFHELPEGKRWFGYSFFALDSTKFTVPKELEGDGFDSMNDCDSYYPQAMLTYINAKPRIANHKTLRLVIAYH